MFNATHDKVPKIPVLPNQKLQFVIYQSSISHEWYSRPKFTPLPHLMPGYNITARKPFPSQRHIPFYKITKIVRAFWLADSSVCMRVCKHGCGVKLFGFSRANHASTKFEKVFEFKTRQVYFIYPFLRRLKHGKSLQRRWVNFSSLKLTF